MLFVYLILSAQYESYLLPLSVILSIPFGLAGAFLFTNLFGKQNDIYMQISLIMLIGLLAKNAILIVEFALERRRTGMAISWSAVLGAGARLRPILMTSLAMIIGLLPLLWPFGVGANGNQTLGASAIGGMLIGMICQIMIVPALFVIFQYLQEKIKPIEFEGEETASVDTELLQYTYPINKIRKIRMKKINIILMSVAVLMSSCGLYNKYERPEINTKGLVRDVSSSTDTLAVNDTTSFGNLAWRSVFTDPQLQSLIEQGLAHNVNLVNAALNVKIIEEQLKCAKLAFVPSFTFSPQGTIASWDGGKATKSYSLPISASWTIDLFGNILSQKRSVQAALLATKDYQLVVKTKLIANIANAYYTLLMLDKQIEVVTDMEKLTKETWETMKFLKDNKIGYRSTSVQSAEANYYSVQAQKIDLIRQVREVENSLSLLLGQQAQTIKRGKLEEQSLPTEFSTGIALQMLNNRPDVHYAEMSLAQCFYDVQTARSRFYPNITISGTGTFTNSGAEIINPGKWLLSAIGSLVQPIFQNGRLIAGLKVAKIQQEQAYNTWQNAVLSAGSEVSDALVLYNSSNEKSIVEGKQIDVLKQNVEDTKKLMASSGSTYLEVITAQQSLLNAELSKIVDDFYKMQAVVNLYYALGGGRD